MKINLNKIKLSPVAIQFMCWVALLIADVLINVFKNHGALWGVATIVFGLVGFFLPSDNKEKFGYAFSALLICLPIGGILQNKKKLDDANYLNSKVLLESQKETFDDSLYKTSDGKSNCEFTGKYANFHKLKCQAGVLAIESKNSKLTSKALIDKDRIRVKNERIDSQINNLHRSISWSVFFGDPEIFRGVVGSFLIPLLILAAFPRAKEKSFELPKPETKPENIEIENSEFSLDDKVIFLLQKKQSKTTIARSLNIRRGKVYEIIAKYKKVSGEHFLTESNTDHTQAEHSPDTYRAKGERWGHKGNVKIKMWGNSNAAN